MIGRLERPSQPPRKTRKAVKAHYATGTHAALHSLYAAKIAAALLYASRRDLAAIIAALRSEEKAAVAALKIRRLSALRPAGKPLFSRRQRPPRRRRALPRKRGHHLPAPP